MVLYQTGSSDMIQSKLATTKLSPNTRMNTAAPLPRFTSRRPSQIQSP